VLLHISVDTDMFFQDYLIRKFKRTALFQIEIICIFCLSLNQYNASLLNKRKFSFSDITEPTFSNSLSRLYIACTPQNIKKTQQISYNLFSQKEKQILGLNVLSWRSDGSANEAQHLMYANFSRNICETETSAVFEHIVFAKGLFLDVHLESVLGLPRVYF